MINVDQNKLTEWFELTILLEETKAKEVALRRELFASAFPDPVEGAKNKLPLADGYVLQGDYKISRTLDAKVVAELLDGDNTKTLVEKLVTFKPSLVLKEWKTLADDDLRLVADMVTEKPGMPALKVVLPKR